MKLTEKALQALRKSKKAKTRLQQVLDKSASTIQRYIDNNSDDLTKAAALQVIREETGLKDDDILEGELAA